MFRGLKSIEEVVPGIMKSLASGGCSGRSSPVLMKTTGHRRHTRLVPDDRRGAFYRRKMENQGRHDDNKKSEELPMEKPLPAAPGFTSGIASGAASVLIPVGVPGLFK